MQEASEDGLGNKKKAAGCAGRFHTPALPPDVERQRERNPLQEPRSNGNALV